MLTKKMNVILIKIVLLFIRYLPRPMKLIFFKDAGNEFSREIFFGHFDILNTNEIRQFLTAILPYTLPDAIRESNICMLLFVLSTLCEFVSFVDDDIDDKYISLFNAMRIHIEQTLQKALSQPDTIRKFTTVHQCILSLLWNLNDRTILVPSLLQAGFGKSVPEWLNRPVLTDAERRPLISVLHNLARHDDGADELNKYGAIETINRLQLLAPYINRRWHYLILWH